MAGTKSIFTAENKVDFQDEEQSQFSRQGDGVIKAGLSFRGAKESF
jgi:hypothetical protein